MRYILDNLQSSQRHWECGVSRINIFCTAFVLLFFCIVVAKVLFLSNTWLTMGGDEWRIGDWLINYQGGFVRRGAFGELLLIMHDLFSIDILSFIISLQNLLIISLLLISFLLFLKQEQKWPWIMLLTSPATFAYYLINPESYRKELLIFFLFAVSCYIINTYAKHGRIAVFFSLVSCVFLMFVHEMFIFFAPYFVILNSRLEQSKRLSVVAISVIFVFMLTACALMVIYHGDINTAEAIVTSLDDKVPHKSLSSEKEGQPFGAIHTLGTTLQQARKEVASRVFGHRYYQVYSVCIFLILISFIPIFIAYEHHFPSDMIVQMAWAWIITGTILLMFIAWDWGRFIHINVMMIMFLLLSSTPKPKAPVNHNPLTVLTFFLVAILYHTTWHLPISKTGYRELANIYRVLF